ncbi:MAG: hypothetical protein SF052_13310 [Bacteroidia bacterium]|nr:hypothetical protein [Bacteroidia bacterium]
MKYLSIIGVGIFCLLIGCVDDFSEANPPRPLDSPFFILSTNQTTLRSDQTAELTLSVVDAPGKIDSVDFFLPEGKGTVTLDAASFNSEKGKEKGTFKGIFTPADNTEGAVTITVTLYDAQEDQNRKSHVETVNLTVKFACTGKDISGTYDTESCEDSVKKVTINASGDQFNLSDLTAGTFGIDVPVVLVCDNGLLSAASVVVDTFEFSGITGEYDPDGSFYLEWTVTSPGAGSGDCVTEFNPE